jgi:hypothetical protein
VPLTLTALAAFIAAACAVASPISAAAATPATAAANPIGAHSMLQLNDPPSFMEAMFAEGAAMHASAIRLDVAPALIFTAQSEPPDFSRLDEVMALAQSYHLRVVADLLTIPTWMAQCATPTSDPSRCATTDLSGYAAVVTQIVSHADPVIHDWEIWDEPDTAEFFDGTPQQYAFMLRAADDAIKAVDPADNVLLGGISGIAGMSWLAQVFATPGADAAHAFDTANVHERADLWQLAPDLAGWRSFLTGYGFGGPLWVTEHGYPSDPQFQYDPGYVGGDAAQAAYLQASIPTLVDAGAAEVFVTERDNLGGSFASEGVLGGNVADPPPADPQIVQKPSFAVVQAIADCFTLLRRDCPGAAAVGSPSEAAAPAAAPGEASATSVTVTDPGAVPIELGAATVTGPYAAGLSVAADGCAGMVLEPRETCAVAVRFAPATGGNAAAHLELSTDDGPLDVPVIATAPSVSALASPELPYPQFSPTAAGDGVGYQQRLRLMLANPLSARVAIGHVALSGTGARRFRVTADRCAHTTLRAHGGCRLTVLFTPTRAGATRAQLTVSGTGLPLTAQIDPAAFALATVTRVALAGGHRCAVVPGAAVSITVSQTAAVDWTLSRAQEAGREACPCTAPPAGPVAASGTAQTGRHGRRGYAASWSLPDGSPRLAPGPYVLTVSAVNRHGTGPSRSLAVRLQP